MRREFKIVFTTIEDGWIMAQAPELPGAVTQGRTMKEARMMIKEVVETLLDIYRDDAKRGIPSNAVWETLAVDVSAA